ncbi:MAG: DUF2911 domain-containing protein [Synoicihabitans sp.]
MKTFILITTAILTTGFASAQRLRTPTLSPITKITQEVGLTEIALEYSRPSAKGRRVMGALVPYGEIWRTGANASTKITFTESATISGKPIEAGTYALYSIPRKETWTIIIHGNTKMRSLAGDVYKPENDIFRFEAPAKNSADYVETFTLQFANLRTDAVDLELRWANTVITIPIGVEVNHKITAQMTELLKNPDKIPHRTYFQAAEYNLHNNGDLDTALAWINTALDMKAKDPRYGLLKAKIQAKRGNRKAAMDTINQAHDWAVESNNANYTGQTDLFRASLKK